MFRSMMAGATALMAASCAPVDPARTAASVPEAMAAGEPVPCVDIVRIRESRVRDDRTIDFVLTDGAILRNTLPNRCPGLGFERAFSYATSLSRLCNVDVITVVNQGGGIRRGASCGLGMFQPVTLGEGVAARAG